jgi:hypothetical protein
MEEMKRLWNNYIDRCVEVSDQIEKNVSTVNPYAKPMFDMQKQVLRYMKETQYMTVNQDSTKNKKKRK